jgi:hypothetical protein
MIFQYTWPQVVRRNKTATRRLINSGEQAVRGPHNKIISVQVNDRVKWRIGAPYAVQPGRGQGQIARIRLMRITQQQLDRITNAEARAEGFADRRAFLQTWAAIHGPDNKRSQVWGLEFELVEIRPALATLAWPSTMRQVPVVAPGLD